MSTTNKPAQSWLLTDEKRVEAWAAFVELSQGSLEIERAEDGSFEVSMHHGVVDSYLFTIQDGVAYLPVRFASVYRLTIGVRRRFFLENKPDCPPPIISTFGCPKQANVFILKIAGLELSLDEFPKVITDYADLSSCQSIRSLRDVTKHIDVCTKLFLPPSFVGGLLSFMETRGAGDIRSRTIGTSVTVQPGSMPTPPNYERLQQATNIVTECMRAGETMLACQERLIDADLSEYAEYE